MSGFLELYPLPLGQTLLELGREFWPISYSVAIIIGLTQGVMIGRGIVERFPRLQFHARFALLGLLVLFVLYGVSNVLRFAYPVKLDLVQVLSANDIDAVLYAVLNVLGIGPDLGAMIAVGITASVIFLLRLTGLKGYKSNFMLSMGAIMVTVVILTKLADYIPSNFELILFSLYHAGIAGGLLWGAGKRLKSEEIRSRNFSDWWSGAVKND